MPHKYRCGICAATKIIDGAKGEVYLVPHCDRCTLMMHLVPENPVPEDWEHYTDDTDI
jgi:hypothetical protein